MGRLVGDIELRDSAGCIKREVTLLERLDLNQAGAIGLLVQAVPRLRRTFRALGTLMMSMDMMTGDYGAWLRLHMVMGRRR